MSHQRIAANGIANGGKMASQEPFVSSVFSVEPGWIDYNGHMNMAYYNVLFDRCADEAFAEFGVSADYVRERSMSVFTAEIHICYVRELHEGDKVTVTVTPNDGEDDGSADTSAAVSHLIVICARPSRQTNHHI